MNTSNDIVDVQCPFKDIADFLAYQLTAYLSAVGVVLNTYCIVVFSLIVAKERTVGNMFKFLLVKAIHDDIQAVIQIFALFYSCVSCQTFGTYWMQVWYIYFYFYIGSINQLCSGWLEIASTLDRLIMIYNIFSFGKTKLYFIIVNVVLIIYSSVFYLDYIFTFRIVEKHVAMNSTSSNDSYEITYFAYELTEFSSSTFAVVLQLWETLHRDAIVMILLVILNTFILIKFKETMSKKRNRMQKLSIIPNPATHETNASVNSTRPTATSNAQMQSVEAAERNLTIMIVMTGINYIIGHTATFVNQAIFFGVLSPTKDCLIKMSLFFFYFSYSTPFLIYVSVNKLFRSYAFGFIKRLT